MSEPKAYHVGSDAKLMPATRMEIDDDARGLVWMFEPPRPRATYIMGIDPTVGIVDWDRSLRHVDDVRTDNGAIEIIRVGRLGDQDVQVCEYAAPIDPEALADVANGLGRLYGGDTDDTQCLCIIEVYPGPGLLTLRRMINHFGYTNQFVWKYLDSYAARQTASLGWTASPKSVRDLWIRGSRHIIQKKISLRSPWLVEEMSDCEKDPQRMAARAIFGSHDDRVRAILLAIWAGHEWSSDIETEKVETGEGENQPDWQKSDITDRDLAIAWEDRWCELSGE